MKSALLLLLGASLALSIGCDDGGSDEPGIDAAPPVDAAPPDAPPTPFTECRGTDESFVRQAELALIGRRPLSQDETNVYAAIMKGVRERDGAEGEPLHPRRVAARALMENPEFTDRWQRHFNDKLRVQRIDDQEMSSCYAKPSRPEDDGELARAVVGKSALTGKVGGSFNMYDLIRSAVRADDVTPIYRANLFGMMTRAIPAANVPAKEAEIARREDFGNTFDAVYLNRDMFCLGCHNSEFSTTDGDDPASDRHWPLPGLFEQALYGSSGGIEARKAHAMLRFSGVVFAGETTPWGWSYEECGSFNAAPSNPDDVGDEARFGSILGLNKTVFDTEASLARGFAKLREDGLELGASNVISDPDAAFAYLVAVTIVDGVFQEIAGNSLVIANYFPRNEASRDLLHLLTEKFVASGFSLRALVEEIVVSPYFDRLPPSSGCGAGPYNMPAVFDPWVISDADAERRKNGPGDGVNSLSTRTAATAAYAALGWVLPSFFDFPFDFSFDPFEDDKAADERAFQRATGFFLKNAERGFRGLDFQARLEWENRFAKCTAPVIAGQPRPTDFVKSLVARVTPTTTYRDLVLALKDRLLADASVRDAGEEAALAAVLGAPLDSPAARSDLEARVRRVCGAMMSSPQFLLAGLAPLDSPPVPALTPTELRFDAVCAKVAARPLPESLTITCSAGSLTVD